MVPTPPKTARAPEPSPSTPVLSCALTGSTNTATPPTGALPRGTPTRTPCCTPPRAAPCDAHADLRGRTAQQLDVRLRGPRPRLSLVRHRPPEGAGRFAAQADRRSRQAPALHIPVRTRRHLPA